MKRLDLTGKVFGLWTVHEWLGGKPHGKWRCVCQCGVERAVTGANLRSGHSVSCGVCTRPEYAKRAAANRDTRGDKNPKVKALKASGKPYLPSSSVWYKRAAGIAHNAKRNGVPVGFASVMEFALYVKSIAPAKCPVFDCPFVERGKGFSPWSPSIDKKDPALGYVPGNIQVISMLANAMKRDATPEQLQQFAQWVLSSKG